MTDAVHHPPHYKALGMECIDLIYSVSSAEEFKGYCKGCALKYRFRAGRKNNPLEDIAKAMQYEAWFDAVETGVYKEWLPSEHVEEEVSE
jgi:hypothetical protein